MSQITDLLDPKVLFSKENLFLKYAGNTHRRIFESFDKTARLQLTFAMDLLDLNRKRFDTLYNDETLADKFASHLNLAIDISKRTAVWAGDLQEVAVDLQGGVSHAVIELVSPASAKAPAAKAKKEKKGK